MLLPWKTKKPREILSKVTLCGTKWVMVQNFLNQGLVNCGKQWDQFREDVYPIHAVRPMLTH